MKFPTHPGIVVSFWIRSQGGLSRKVPTKNQELEYHKFKVNINPYEYDEI